jgi:hypothetical protein
VAYIPLSAADTHHCSVDTDELFHAYFFYVSTWHRCPSFTSESTLSPPMNGPTVLPREVWLCTLENGKN